jgi:hypothetical protein
MLKNDVFSLDACYKVDIVTSGASEWVANFIDNSLSGHESTNMRASASQEAFLINFPGKGVMDLCNKYNTRELCVLIYTCNSKRVIFFK